MGKQLEKWKGLLLLKTKFFTTSVVATSVEYLLYFIFNWLGFPKRIAQLVSYLLAVILNFILQKQFVFQLNRTLSQAFIGAMAVSFVGMLLNFGIYNFLLGYEYFNTNHYFAKLAATGIVFFYNFYMKRFVFEKKFI